MLKTPLPTKKSLESDFAATVENHLRSAIKEAIPDADPCTEDTKKHLIPA
jgi:hypothetical protein